MHKLGVWIIIVTCVWISMLMDLVRGLATHVKYVVESVSDNSCHGLESNRVCKLHEMLKRSMGESLFFPSSRSSERAKCHRQNPRSILRSRSAIDG